MPSGERRRRVQSTSDLQHLAFLKKVHGDRLFILEHLSLEHLTFKNV